MKKLKNQNITINDTILQKKPEFATEKINDFIHFRLLPLFIFLKNLKCLNHQNSLVN